MRRAVLLIGLAACEEPAAPKPPPPIHYVYPPGVTAWASTGPVRGRVGRSQAPAPARNLGITGELAPLTLPTVWAVPGDGPARAVVYGILGDRSVIELVDIDAGTIVWRDTSACTGPVVGISHDTVVCADVHGTRAVQLSDRTIDWETTEPFIAIDDDRVVIAGIGNVSIRKLDGGDEIGHPKLAPGIDATRVNATCANKDVFAVIDTKLVKIVDGKIAWTATTGTPQKLDACGGSIVVSRVAESGDLELVSVARDTGKLGAIITGVRGWWPARDGGDRLDVSTAEGVAIVSRDLATREMTSLPALAEWIASRGDRRLVRATPTTAVVLDAKGIVAYVPFAEEGGALGDRALVASSWSGNPTETLHRRELPPATPMLVHVPAIRPGTAVAAELRDLPPVVDASGVPIIAPGDGGKPYATLAIDPFAPNIVHAVTGTEDATSIARLDLATGTWGTTVDCEAGAPAGVAIGRDVVACASHRGITGFRTGSTWTWKHALDRVSAGGDIVLGFTGDRATILDARDGRAIGELASDDGGPVRAIAVQRGTETWLAAVERGAIVVRLPLAGMLPMWSIAVDGVVASLATSGDGILVTLEDGDAYRIELRGPTIAPIPGLGLAWNAMPDLVAGSAAGGPIYGARPPPVPLPRPVIPLPPRPPPPPPDPNFAPPPIAVPLPIPPVIGHAWQLALYDLAGGLRARNDYQLRDATLARVRAPGAPLVVVSLGAAGLELLVLDAATGNPIARVAVPGGGAPVSTVVDGKPVVGYVIGAPLRIIPIR